MDTPVDTGYSMKIHQTQREYMLLTSLTSQLFWNLSHRNAEDSVFEISGFRLNPPNPRCLWIQRIAIRFLDSCKGTQNPVLDSGIGTQIFPKNFTIN